MKTMNNFSQALRFFRTKQGLSQLDLSLEADVSTKHISFLESGRSQPSKSMIEQLAFALKLDWDDINSLLNSAGFINEYKASRLESPENKIVKEAFERIIKLNEEYPVLLLGKYMSLEFSNEKAQKLFAKIKIPQDSVQFQGKPNLLLIFFSSSIQQITNNWAQIAKLLLLRLSKESKAWDTQYQSLIKLIKPQLPLLKSVELSSLAAYAPVQFKFDNLHLNFFTVLSSLGSSIDVNLSDLKIETYYPEDERTKKYLREI